MASRKHTKASTIASNRSPDLWWGCSFVDSDGKTYFGRVLRPNNTPANNHDIRNSELAGLVLIEDAVTPQRYKFPKGLLQEVIKGKEGKPSSVLDGSIPATNDEIGLYQFSQQKQAIATVIEAKGCIMVGSMFTLPSKNLASYYVITSIKGLQCLVEHRKFFGNWECNSQMGLGGWVNLQDVIIYIFAFHAAHFGGK